MERERPVAVAVVVAMSRRSIVDSNPTAYARRRALSLVDTAEVVGCHQWWKVVAAR